MKKETEKATVDTEEAISCESEDSTVTTEAISENSESGKGGNKRLKSAIIRMAAALVAAAIMLAITGFAPITLLKGPEETEAIQSNELGDFVCRDIYVILGFYANDKNKSDETTGRYAAVPMNGKLVSVYFTERYLKSAGAVCDNTYDFVNGKAEKLDKYVVVEGTVEKIGEDASALMYDWFGTNKDQLVEIKMIADTDDYSDYLSDYLLVVDTVKSHSETYVYVTGIIAAMLLLYAIVEIVLMSIGFYLPKPEKELCCECVACSEEDGTKDETEDETEDGTKDETKYETEDGTEDDKPEDKE